jgi:molybdenum cofactor biosynthesis protein A
MLTDQLGRKHTYLRISLTDACNMRCSYCMPLSSYHGTKSNKLMNASEIFELAHIFVQHGVTKIRLTGGEPLLRKDFDEILEKLATLPVNIGLTTNGLLLDKHFEVLQKYGVKHINISLDSLDAEEFKRITHTGQLEKIMLHINHLLELKMQVKINLVMLKNVNEHAIIDFVNWTEKHALDVRFIEFMPFEKNDWNKEKVLDYQSVLSNLEKQFDIIKIEDEDNSTSRNYKVKGFKGNFGFITTVTNPFCESCNRLRLTADGKLRNCLFAKNETDLLTPLRNGENVLSLIQQNVMSKAAALGGMNDLHSNSERSMIQIGG